MTIHLNLSGPANQMMMLLCLDETKLEDTVMYVVNNASCYAKAIEAIAESANLTQRQADDLVYRQNGKKFKVKLLKALGFTKLSALNLNQLNELILSHYEDAHTTKGVCR